MVTVKDPLLIEKKSFDIIQGNLGKYTFSELELPVITRVIHATADFDFAETMVFSRNAIYSGIQSIKEGCCIVTDVNMVKVGVNKKIIEKYGGEVICRISDDDVIDEAKRENTTRAAVSIRRSKEIIDNGILAVGNSPTAIEEAIRLIKEENIVPKLVVGMPVGFVGAEESKEELMKLSHIPYISNTGKRGGTPAAVAVINALLKMTDRTVN